VSGSIVIGALIGKVMVVIVDQAAAVVVVQCWNVSFRHIFILFVCL
jgi:hypothetical protein